jgi:hypothetical protein
MRKISLFAAATVLILAGLGGWVASTTHARVEAAVAVGGIYPSQITMNAHDMPTEEFADYTFVFN